MAITASFIGEFSNSSNLTGYSFSSINFGDEQSDRYIAAFIVSHDSDNSQVTSCTIGGVSATLTTIYASTNGYDVRPIKIAVANVPTGTSGSISYSHSSQMTGSAIVVFRLTGLKSTTPLYVADDEANAGTLSASIPVQRGGIVLGLLVNTTDDSPGSTTTWPELTEVWDGYLERYEGSAAYKIFTETELNTSISSVTTGTISNSHLCLASFAAYSQFTNPGNVYAQDNTYATCPATSGELQIELSIDGGETYGNILSQTFTSTEEEKTYGNGTTELWGLSPTRADMIDSLFRLRITNGDYSQVYSGFGFATGTEILTGIEVVVEAKFDAGTLSIDHIKVKIYYGTSVLPIQMGSLAFASDGRKNGESAGNGSGVLVFYDGVSWIACDSGQTVAD